MIRILSTILLTATVLCSVWIAPFSHAQTVKASAPRSKAPAITTAAENNLTKIAQPERTVATFGDGRSAMALLDGNTVSGYQLVALGETCSVTLDLGTVNNVARVCVFTYDQAYTFRILTSIDGVTYTPVGENTVGKNYSSETGYVVDISPRECRFLRLEGLTGQFGYFSLYEIEVYADYSEKNPLAEVSIPQATAVSLANGSGADALVDGNYTGSYQMIPEGEQCFAVLKLDRAYTVREVKVHTYSADYRFRIEGSLDGINYLPLGENTPDETYDPLAGYSIPVVNGTYRYIRLVGLEGQYGFFSLYEIDVFADLTPTRPLLDNKLYETAVLGHASAFLADGSEVPLLIDGNRSGSYRMIPEGENCYVTVALNEEYTVQKVTVYTYEGGYGFALEGSLDGISYTPLGVNDVTADYDPEKGYSITITSGNYRYLRVKGAVCPYGFFSLYEIDVFATKSPPIRGDVNRDMVINVDDLNLMLVALSTGEALTYGDLDGNGILNVTDLNELLVILSTQQ